MPRASWRGFLRLSLVSCPVYLSPATSRAKSIRLHQIWRPAPGRDRDDDGPERQSRRGDDPEPAPRRERETRERGQVSSQNEFGKDEAEQAPLSRVMIRPHDPATGEEIDKAEIVKGYEYERGQFVTFTQEELKALDVESSRVIDLETFVPRLEVDPVYFDSGYYLYPDGEIAAQTLRVIGAAMTERNVVGIGRLTLSRRERAVMVDPRGSGMALFTLHAAEDVRPAAFPEDAGGEVDPEMVAIAGVIVEQRQGHFDLRQYPDRYQAALRALIEAKMKGLPVKPQSVETPAPVVDLMSALRLSLAAENPDQGARAPVGARRVRSAGDRRQKTLLLPLPGAKKASRPAESVTPASAARRRKKA